jgi:hypothetical protein
MFDSDAKVVSIKLQPESSPVARTVARCSVVALPERMPGIFGGRALLAASLVVDGRQIRNPKFRAGGCILYPDGRVCGQAFCLHTVVSYAIVPFPLPIGRGVFFVMSEKRGVEILLA